MTATFSAPDTLAEALEAIAAGARPVAGGTDLVVGHRQGKAPLPASLVAIHRIRDLEGISERDAGLRMGALTRHEEIVRHEAIRMRYTALADASAIVGSHATRHVGTLGGNVMNASPAMETGGPLICFDATAVLLSGGGERRVPVADLLVGPGRTSAERDELLVAVELPPPAATGSSYVRLEYRRHMEIAVVGATCAVAMDGDRVTAARVAITALAPTIRRVPAAEHALTGGTVDADQIRAAGDAAADASEPISDVRAPADYRRAMAAVVARRAITAALDRARGTDVPIPASPALHGAT